MNSDPNIYEKLISEITDNRNDLRKLLTDVEKFDPALEDIFKPTDNDYRKRISNMSVAGEKIKGALDIIKSKHDIRKSIDSSVKLEIDMRRQIAKDVAKEDENSVNSDTARRMYEEMKKLNLDIE